MCVYYRRHSLVRNSWTKASRPRWPWKRGLWMKKPIDQITNPIRAASWTHYLTLFWVPHPLQSHLKLAHCVCSQRHVVSVKTVYISFYLSMCTYLPKTLDFLWRIHTHSSLNVFEVCTSTVKCLSLFRDEYFSSRTEPSGYIFSF